MDKTIEETEQERIRHEKIKKEAKKWVIWIVGMSVLYFGIIRLFVFENYSVDGASMQPT